MCPPWVSVTQSALLACSLIGDGQSAACRLIVGRGDGDGRLSTAEDGSGRTAVAVDWRTFDVVAVSLGVASIDSCDCSLAVLCPTPGWPELIDIERPRDSDAIEDRPVIVVICTSAVDTHTDTHTPTSSYTELCKPTQIMCSVLWDWLQSVTGYCSHQNYTSAKLTIDSLA